MRFTISSLIAVALLVFFSCTQNENDVLFYVSLKGSDENIGSIEKPFSSIEKAQDAVRKFKQEKGIPKNGITIYFREGNYPFRKTIHFTSEDNGKEDAPVVYCAYPGEKVRFNGGEIIKNFVPLSNEDALSRISLNIHDKIWQANLKIENIPYNSKELQPFGPELFFNDEPMTLARYPNIGEWLRIASVPQFGDTLLNKGSERDMRFGVPVGRHYGRFKYNGNTPDKWGKNDDIWLHGYWSWDWADSYIRIDSIDAVKNEFSLKKPHSAYGYTQDQRYYALNILEELDSPGEWYIDNVKDILYFWPPSPINQGLAIVSVLDDPMIYLEQTDYIQFKGIIFESSRGEAIRIDGGSHNLIGGCTIRNIGSNGIIVDGGHFNGVKSCEISNMGRGSIIISGGDRQTLSVGNNFAINNHIHHYGRIKKTYSAAIDLSGVGNLIGHNHIHDAPHTGVLFSGNNNILEFNEVHHIAQETGDVGAFYIGRDWTQRGNIIRHNYFHHLHGPGLYGVMAIYLDDAASGTSIFGNVFYQSGQSVFVGGGHDNIVENNIFVDCSTAIHLDARGINWARELMKKGGGNKMYEKLEAINFKNPPYSTQYPSLAKILDWGDPAMPRGNIFRTNLCYGGRWHEIEADVNEVTIENNYIIDSIPSYINVEKGKLYPENEMILREMNFRKIPFNQIGLQIDEFRRSL